ncbi:MAG: DUF2062 domain-containing protein [Calditrichae bacterium]|nr:DUF2062 domain-containing protein [Calditrichota bacterium]MCB9057023.1 DUF2062 domain-containing protein [Calditrichia bacterium]
MIKKIIHLLKNYFNIRIKPKLKRLINDVMHPGNHPRQTALSLAIGVFIGIWIPMGLQLWTMILLLSFVNYNFFMATLVSFISNPLTVLPLYYIAIKIGEWLLQSRFSWQFFSDFIEHPVFAKLLDFGTDSLVILATGLTFLAVVSAGITYFTTLKLVVYLRNRKQIVKTGL